jgi:sensor histidine kinase YesM
VLALGGLLLFIVIWLTAYAYVKHRQAREMLSLKREKKQKELQISSIRLKAIPHFHANVLAAIEYFVMNNSADEASKYLKLYSDFTNLTLLDIDKPARTVDEEVDYVTKYLELEKLRYGERLTYSIGVAEDVDRTVMLPTMLLHTYVENAIKHGISPKPEGGHVDVIITRHDDQTVVTVEDNGIGRKKAQKLSKGATKMGLRILNEQIQLYNKSNKGRIREHVRNVKNADGKTVGTIFQLTIPKGFIYE